MAGSSSSASFLRTSSTRACSVPRAVWVAAHTSVRSAPSHPTPPQAGPCPLAAAGSDASAPIPHCPPAWQQPQCASKVQEFGWGVTSAQRQMYRGRVTRDQGVVPLAACHSCICHKHLPVKGASHLPTSCLQISCSDFPVLTASTASRGLASPKGLAFAVPLRSASICRQPTAAACCSSWSALALCLWT